MSKVQTSPLQNTASSAEESDENALLRENIAALVLIKNENIAQFSQEKMNITSALIEQKWHNRHQVYPYRVKEEIYGTVLNEIMTHKPQFKNEILAKLEAVYQTLRNEESQTLSRTRALVENSYKTPHL
ncbi:putative cytoplasmic protein [Buttiauxella brennerae ATCC 51605]|uniref:Putative cytoplasmic protein n=1 Tax=Buttiauxella brennerae ATCC 51605 TaxID=1354251 RepID=A0A1B7IXA7_9ENTR|nr:hypothetical protein [Buttiauxella brennerae]OAT34686.1 putative cytoplasmic protein [Buttiauxella brennerae ATCC 51605]